MLKIKAIAPLRLESQELQRRQRRYDALAGSELSVTLVNLEGKNAPKRLENGDDLAASEELTLQMIRDTSPNSFDAILPDCVLDPGVCVDQDAHLPVYGILRLSGGFIHALGYSFAAVTRNETIGGELARKIERYGFSSSLRSVETLNVDFCFVSDHDQWEGAMKPLAESLSKRGIGVLFNGCSAVDIAKRRVGGLVIIDPTELALQLLIAADKVGLTFTSNDLPSRLAEVSLIGGLSGTAGLNGSTESSVDQGYASGI